MTNKNICGNNNDDDNDSKVKYRSQKLSFKLAKKKTIRTNRTWGGGSPFDVKYFIKVKFGKAKFLEVKFGKAK